MIGNGSGEYIIGQAVTRVVKYFDPGSEYMIVSFDPYHATGTNVSPFVTGLHCGVVTLEDNLRNGDTGFNVDIPTVLPVADVFGDEMKVNMQFVEFVRDHRYPMVVAGFLHNDRYMESLMRDLTASDFHDFFIAGLSIGKAGVSRIGMHQGRVDEKVKIYGEKVVPDLSEKKGVENPVVIGLPPLGSALGGIVAQELGGDLYDYNELERNGDGMHCETFEGRDVVIADSRFLRPHMNELNLLKKELLEGGANRALYVVYHGPMNHPTVDFAANVTEYL